MAVTGGCLGFFLVAHLLGSSTVFLGRDVFLAYAEKLHGLGPLIYIAEFCLLSLFILHIIFGLILYFDNLKARPCRYGIQKNKGARTIGSKTMPYTGIIILIFLLVHLNNFHFTDPTLPIADIVHEAFLQPALVIFYLFSLIALILHTSHGFWSLFQTLGINHPKYNNFLQTGGLMISIGIGLVFILIPLAVFTCRTLLL